ncbi:hypothetical protein CO669_06935 [Bradyrhizobium sp. Y36]|uniref:hypothetical protein n=1 Tax=Bradyrhizobium sp. Y36 TaxID=2035447 RepID=UPI000BE9E52C|nr:hypothetical protein [Bradyrhizobium sp. Y36]PDT90717.1 hypothetical protein CO669_06935 [Bradyrhizobium sp. Y36]
MRFADFVAELRDRYGEEALGARHEIFFTCARPSPLWPAVRAALAALRDAFLCLGLEARASVSSPVVVIASRGGSSGLDALQPFMDDLDRRGIDYRKMVHPRLRAAVAGASGPLRPAPRAWLHACQAFWISFARPDQRAFAVRCCLFRLRLWQGAWSRALSGRSGGVLVLHNDFELFCVAALTAGMGRWRGVCIQHGLPTDEFFPTRAPRQVVWGDRSRAAYVSQGTSPEAIRFGPFPSPAMRSGATMSAAVALVSQTHTPVFGRSLARDFLELAERLADRMSGHGHFAILLHPEEVKLGHPFAKTRLAGLCRLPPHREFGADTGPSSILVGFCSTALIKGAQQGHLVIGMNWPVTASHASLLVGRPAVVADNPDQLCDLIERLLADPAERASLMKTQQAWLDRTFADGDDWLPEVTA